MSQVLEGLARCAGTRYLRGFGAVCPALFSGRRRMDPSGRLGRAPVHSAASSRPFGKTHDAAETRVAGQRRGGGLERSHAAVAGQGDR